MIKRAFKEKRKGFIPSSSRTAPRSWKNTLFLFFSLLFFLYFLALSFSSSSFFFSFFFSLPFFFFSFDQSEGLRRDTGVVFCCYRDRIYIGDIILDDVVIRYAGIHDAAFDVNCEERRSRFCFIPRQFLLPNKDVQICVPVRRVARQIRSAYLSAALNIILNILLEKRVT